jgi:hypothetical protein
MSIARPEVFREGVKLARGNFVAPALAVKCSHVPEKTAGDFAARPAANTVRRSMFSMASCSFLKICTTIR